MAETIVQKDEDLDQINIQNNIYIKNAHSNNLKNVDLVIPKKKLIVVTGLSGSGKSSLIMDTLYAEGQRRYVESLSSYARQFLNRMKKPEVEYIKGISPAIAIEQRVSSSNSRSTVGSLTEIYDYLRLLFARIGKTYSPVSGELVKKHEVNDVVDFVFSQEPKDKIQLFTYLQNSYERSINQDLSLLLQKGFNRVSHHGELVYIEELLDGKLKGSTEPTQNYREEILILVDRFTADPSEENRNRVADSILTAFTQGDGECLVDIVGKEKSYFNNKFELDGMVFLEPSHQLFNYNNPYGACPKCEGYGQVLGIDPNKVIPNDKLSVHEGAIVCWNGEKGGAFKRKLINSAHKFDFPVTKPICELSEVEYDLLWSGNQYFWGIADYFSELESKTYKIQNRVMLARYRGKTKCPNCKGGRLRKEATYVKINDTDISRLIHIPISELLDWFTSLKLSDHDFQIAKRILIEINARLSILNKVGLSYLTLDRASATLSGGETQRINLTRTLGSNLTNSLYILDEPSIGLHPKDTEKLVDVIQDLRDLGNTVIVVEHEEEVINNADYIIDVGPLAGIHGGEIVFDGPFKKFKKGVKGSLTSEYISGKKEVPIPEMRRKGINKIRIEGANHHNLKNINVEIPLNTLSVVTGVSGSGKTTLVKHLLFPAIKKELGEILSAAPGKMEKVSGDFSRISSVEMINQNPIGKSSRSNPVTYVKAYDAIRSLFASQQLSKIRGYAPKHFSFNVEGGRCETCKGDGNIIVEMQFLADVKLVCEECEGRKFKQDVLEVQYNDKNIYEVLELSVEEAIDFFKERKDIVNKLKPLYDVGLGYVKLGQSSSTLSGGEAQRVKLASFLGKDRRTGPIFFIFDEPTTGLHFHDILKLLDAFNALVENGHTVLVVEHNLDVIKSADYIVDLGPVGGKDGGHLVFQGTPEKLISVKESFTGQYLTDKLTK